MSFLKFLNNISRFIRRHIIYYQNRKLISLFFLFKYVRKLFNKLSNIVSLIICGKNNDNMRHIYILNTCAPVIKKILKSLFEGDFHLPSGFIFKLRCITDE